MFHESFPDALIWVFARRAKKRGTSDTFIAISPTSTLTRKKKKYGILVYPYFVKLAGFVLMPTKKHFPCHFH